MICLNYKTRNPFFSIFYLEYWEIIWARQWDADMEEQNMGQRDKKINKRLEEGRNTFFFVTFFFTQVSFVFMCSLIRFWVTINWLLCSFFLNEDKCGFDSSIVDIFSVGKVFFGEIVSKTGYFCASIPNSLRMIILSFTIE